MLNKLICLVLFSTFGFSSVINESLITEENKMYIVKDELGNNVDQFFIDGMKYFLGEEGVSEETKKYIVKCPYKICKEEIIENKVTTLLKDYKSALILFKKSVDTFENERAAITGLEFLKRQLNWRERKFSSYLVEKWETKIGKGYDMESYIIDVNEFVEVLVKHNNFEGLSTLGDLHYHGVLGYKEDHQKAKIYYDKVLDLCSKKDNFKCYSFKVDYQKRNFN